ncbi:uncharacterized protein LOC132557315 [Ylistrum balloti]|uniref:uncharacterized protein LOC132557315 n=1 Tax=Ylistrum balloti TaxID=509963 RepID=UPI002905F156|nr:uncharacterized protein LOC132557315 [Ylistrum balloti]
MPTETPTFSGMTFEGWYQDAAVTTVFNFENTEIRSSLTVYAKWNGHSYSTVLKNSENGIPDNPNYNQANRAITATASSDGKNVYVMSSILGLEVLVVFNRDATTGTLTHSTNIFTADVGGGTEMMGGRGITVSPDGKNVYVSLFSSTAPAPDDGDGLVVFNRNTTTGSLAYSTVLKDNKNGVDGLAGAYTITVSPDGKNVYVAGSTDDALAVFDRDTTTGALTYSTNFKDGVNGVDGLEGAIFIAVSPDGENVYVAGFDDDALAVFNRDTTTGALAYNAVFKDNQGEVDGLNEAFSVTVSPDGKNVYVAGFEDDALAVFNRDTETGALTYSNVFKNGTNGVDGLNGAFSVTVSPDGKNVYVASDADNALVVFKRNTTTGALTYSTVFKDGVNGVDGLKEAQFVTLSPNGKSIYVGGRGDGILAVFHRR